MVVPRGSGAGYGKAASKQLRGSSGTGRRRLKNIETRDWSGRKEMTAAGIAARTMFDGQE